VMLKRQLKSAAIAGCRRFAPYLPTPRTRRWFCDRVAPWLMDPLVLPRGLVERPKKRLPVRVLCDPYVYVHRNDYWCGVFFEEEVENYLLREVAPGDTVIDVGMNVGHVALPAAARVGPAGTVIAFEPNGELVERVQRIAREQDLGQLVVYGFGLGNADAQVELRMDPDHSGGASFRAGSAGAAGAQRALACRVRRGDAVIRKEWLKRRVFLKMDVEGFELEALEGLRETLPRVDHAIVEVSPEWLGADGVRALLGMLSAAGLHPHRLARDGRIGPAVDAAAIAAQSNIVFRRAAAS
jgi:FkbM family methyltransferase